MTDDDVTAAKSWLANGSHAGSAEAADRFAAAIVALAPVPPDVAKAAERLTSLDNWLFNGLDEFPEGLGVSGLVKDARLVARWVRDGRRAAGGGA